MTAMCHTALQAMGFEYSQSSISPAKMIEVVNCAERDLKRIAEDLKDKISREKFAAYHGYWFAKLSPVSEVHRVSGGKRDGEIVDINERLAIQITVQLLLDGAGPPGVRDVEPYSNDQAESIGYEDPPAPLVWRRCKKKCTGRECFFPHTKNFLDYHRDQNREYLVHSLRHKIVDPSVLVGFLEAMIISSCVEARVRKVK